MVLTAFAQSEARFEVASVKMSPEHGGTRLAALDTDPAMVRYANLSLKLLIAMAYRFDSELIKGDPAWLDEQHYDVAAKLPPGAPKDRVPEMMQALLAERFKLAVHRETKDARIYYLVAGKGGPKLKKSDGADAPDPDHVRGDRTPASLIPGGVNRPCDHCSTTCGAAWSCRGIPCCGPHGPGGKLRRQPEMAAGRPRYQLPRSFCRSSGATRTQTGTGQGFGRSPDCRSRREDSHGELRRPNYRAGCSSSAATICAGRGPGGTFSTGRVSDCIATLPSNPSARMV